MTRSQWGSRLGFILAAAGSAVGLGAIWKFPFVAAQNGGGAFLLIFLAITFTLGLALMLAEMSIGRATQQSIVGALRTLKGGGWPVLGYLGVLGGFIVFSFYSVIGGWTIAYFVRALQGDIITRDTVQLGHMLDSFIADPVWPIAALSAFIGLTLAVVLAGVQKGIEQMSKLLMPLLFLLMLALIVRGLTLPGAMAGLLYFVRPDFSKVTADMLISALGLSFFSLSLGNGTLLAYGSYLPKEVRLANSAAWVVGLATLASLLAGLMVLPAVFAVGLDPQAGPGLTFMTMPAVFATLPGGQGFAIAFFALLIVAALTSSVSMLELVSCFLIDEFHLSRRSASLLVSALVFCFAVPASLSFGMLNGVRLGDKTIFDCMDFLASNILMPAVGAGVALFTAWISWPRLANELAGPGQRPLWLHGMWLLCGLVAPVAIGIIWINGL
ncbi:sodium-dependent transporter [Microvirgula aerodenitrificans]|uniref:sodium-dependent transporter n=1 Tax=Microvirgula aerodenitrificans TaxID=57480 RepID=UPI000568AF17|nr:sodium-dependent transporter [Microvirgula aerodenitrificans]